MCSRIAIVCDGQLKCLGSQLHLKKKFGSGLRMKISLLADKNASHLVDEVQRKVSRPVKLLSQSGRTIIGGIPIVTVSLAIPKFSDDAMDIAGLFEFLEESKEELGIREFSVNESTLDDVFINVVENSSQR